MPSSSPDPAAPTDLSGHRALVTGAASGIGGAVAGRLAQAGAVIGAVDRDEAGLKEHAARLGDARIEPVAAALSDLDAIADLPTDVDILVNNAGIQHVSPIESFPLETFELILDVMLHAPFRLVRQSLPTMYAQGWGRVVNLSSAHGLRASPYKVAYVTAKHGLEGLSKVVALEGAPHGVTSNCLNPGYVRTPLVESQIADQARTRGIPEDEVVEKVMLEGMAVKRLVEPAEVAELALFLCGPASASVTGASFAIDGGWTAR
jgi:3-hydroxybutyrate dehydrogenase